MEIIKMQVSSTLLPITQVEEITGEFSVTVIDYNGELLEKVWLDNGKEFELPDLPEHERLLFQQWSCSQNIIDDTLVIDNNDVMIGPIYTTASGATEIDITLTAVTGLTFPLKFSKTDAGTMVIDWGDSTTEDVTNTGAISLTHTYSAVGNYTVKLIFDGEYYFNTYISNNTSRVVNYTIKRMFMSGKVASIGVSAFDSCYSLSSIVIPQGVTSIDNSAFSSCYSLSSIVIPQGVTSIDNSAFSSCYSLSSVVIPQGVTQIGSSAFSSCFSLSSIVIPQGVTSIGGSAFDSCSSLSSVVIPQGVDSIGGNAFQYCSSLSSVVIPQGVTSIGSYAFSSCLPLSSVVIPQGVTSIDSFTFIYCSSLSSVVIPQGVTSIGGNAFNDCRSLTLYDFTACASVPTLSATSAFTGINQICKILVPLALETLWKTATNWATYANYIIGV